MSGHGKSQSTTGGKKRARRPKRHNEEGDGDDDPEAERRMQAAVRNQGRLVKKAGAMVSSGLSEFQVASGDALERLVNRT
jgi:ATP-dependent RNA helicase DDX31/DBP7